MSFSTLMREVVSNRRGSARPDRVISLVFLGLILPGEWLFACPFCTALKPTLAQQTESAAVVALGEFLEQKDKIAVFRLHQILRGKVRLEDPRRLRVAMQTKDLKPGSLALLLGQSDAEAKKLQWSRIGVNELSFVYIARSPSLRMKTAKRLKYFARYLEHADPLIAEDAYLEFGHAPYDEVAEAADSLDQAKLRQWLLDDAVPEARKGFYGLALGLARSPAQRRRNEDFLRVQIEKPSNDLRAGFDGVLGGYLILAGEKGVQLIERKFLANAKAADGDLRHAATALRFCYEYGRKELRPSLRRALRRLLDRPEFAARTIVDLARWQDWEALDRIAGLYDKSKYEAKAIKRAIIGYLLSCPGDQAEEHLDRLRKLDPKTVADAEKSISLFSGNR